MSLDRRMPTRTRRKTTPSEPGARTSRPGRDDRIRRDWIVVALALLTVIAFVPAISNGFVSWDDGPNFLENRSFRGLGWPQFVWAWRTNLLGVYQPLGWLLYSFQYVAWGLEPAGYHLVSIVLHAVNAVVFFLVTASLLACARPDLAAGDRAFGAALAAALFAVHPLRVEVVSWISCQVYLPSALFCLLSLLVYLRACAGGRRRRQLLFGCWLLFLAAVLFKAVAVTLPLVFVILDVYPLRRLGVGRRTFLGSSAREVWLEKLPFLLLGVAFGVIAWVARRWDSRWEPLDIDLPTRLAQAFYGIIFYPVKTFAPIGLTPFNRPPVRFGLVEPMVLACAGVVLGLSIALVLLRRRWPGVLAAWVSYLVLLAPNLGLISFSPMLVADRYSYLATMAGFVLAAAGIASLRSWARARRVDLGVGVAGLVLLLALVPMTWRQCLIWRHSRALWDHAEARFAEAVRVHPRSAEARYDLGMALLEQERLGEATLQFRTAVELEPAIARRHPKLVQFLRVIDRAKEARILPIDWKGLGANR